LQFKGHLLLGGAGRIKRLGRHQHHQRAMAGQLAHDGHAQFTGAQHEDAAGSRV
jgi:hypothetical protein